MKWRVPFLISVRDQIVLQLSFRGEAEKSFVRMWLKMRNPSLMLGMTNVSPVRIATPSRRGRCKRGRSFTAGWILHCYACSVCRMDFFSVASTCLTNRINASLGDTRFLGAGTLANSTFATMNASPSLLSAARASF